MTRQGGYTLLELLVTIAIVGSILAVTAGTGMTDLSQRKTAQNTYKELRDELATANNTATSRNTTAKVIVNVDSSNIYTITTQVSSAPTTTCTTSGSWSTVSSKTLDVHNNYSITGSSMSTSLCFYRDGSSSGGTYVVSPNSGVSGTTYTFTISIATGYIDVVES